MLNNALSDAASLPVNVDIPSENVVIQLGKTHHRPGRAFTESSSAVGWWASKTITMMMRPIHQRPPIRQQPFGLSAVGRRMHATMRTDPALCPSRRGIVDNAVATDREIDHAICGLEEDL